MESLPVSSRAILPSPTEKVSLKDRSVYSPS